MTVLEALKNSVGEWLRGGPEGEVVISSRVRLARNIAGYPFLSRANEQQIARIEEILRNKIMNCGLPASMEYYRLDALDPVLRQLLVERHLIGRDHAEASWVRGVAFGIDERLSLMVNEEAHLRLQSICGGLRLREAYRQAGKADDMLAEVVPFAFSARYGYLTACPTNVGTGMRASVMVHLPAMVMQKEMEKVLQFVQQQSLALRGIYGEGTQASGDLYQISNQVSLGKREEEILDQVSGAVADLIGMEKSARESLLKHHREKLSERIQRALDLLRSASSISSEEALNLLSQVRMGVNLGLAGETALKTINELLLLTLPAHLQTIDGRKAERPERNELRAAYLRKRLMN